MSEVSLFYKRRKNRKKKFLDEVTTASVLLPQRGCPYLLSYFFTKYVSLHYINYQKFAYFFVLKNFDNFGLCFFVTPWLSALYTAFYFIILHKYTPWNIKTYYTILDVTKYYIQTYLHANMQTFKYICIKTCNHNNMQTCKYYYLIYRLAVCTDRQ